MAEKIKDLFLVVQRKPLEKTEPNRLIRWLLRWYFEWRGFACRSHCGECNGKCYASIEYRVIVESEADARWLSNSAGGAYYPLPFCAALPEETVSYKAGDVPQSEASAWYRRGVRLPFKAVPRGEYAQSVENLRQVENRFDDLDDCLKGTCVKA